jgi:hypothetical protein
MKHLKNVDSVPTDMERAAAAITSEKSDWCWNGVKWSNLSVGKQDGGNNHQRSRKSGIGPGARTLPWARNF